MKAPTCKICGQAHRLGPCPQTEVPREADAAAPSRRAAARDGARNTRAKAQTAQDAQLDRPLRDFLDDPALIERLPTEAMQTFARVHHRLAMRARRSQT